MRTVSIKLNDMAIANIQLGFVGENNTTQVIFNCKEIFENNPNAVQSLTVTPPEGEAYPVVTTRVGDTVVWTVSSSDTAYDGEGNVQLTFTDGSEVIKTYNAKTTILESATPGGTAPDPVQNWIDEAEAVLESLDGLTVEAETLEPGSSATAEVSEDPEDGHRHINFGIPQGEKGDTGETPSFSIGTVATGAAGSDASASITGTDEEPVLNLTIPQGLKGDAGNGDMLAPAYSTSATYKAGEYVTYNGGLYCCISDISTAESWTAAHWRSTDFGKDTSALKSALEGGTFTFTKTFMSSNRYSSNTLYNARTESIGKSLSQISTAASTNGYAYMLDVKLSTQVKIPVGTQSSASNYGYLAFDKNDICVWALTFPVGTTAGDIYTVSLPENAVKMLVYFGNTLNSLGTEYELEVTKSNALVKIGEQATEITDIEESIGIMERTAFEVASNSDHSSNNDQIKIAIQSGHKFYVGVSVDDANATSVFMLYAYKADSTNVNIKNWYPGTGGSKLFEFELNYDIVAVGVFYRNKVLSTVNVKAFVSDNIEISMLESVQAETDNIQNQVGKIYRNSFSVNAGGSHSSNSDKIEVDIPANTPFVVGVESSIKNSTSVAMFYATKASDSTTASFRNVFPGQTVNTLFTNTLNYDVSAIGVYYSNTTDSTATVKFIVAVGQIEIENLYRAANDSLFVAECNADSTHNILERFAATDDAETFVFYSDPHYLGSNGGMTESRVQNIENEWLRQLALKSDAINAHAVICGGDMINTETSDAELCYKLGMHNAVARKLFGGKYHLALGNHDTRFDAVPQDVLDNMLFADEDTQKAYYSVKTPKTRFYFLNTGTDQNTAMNDYRWLQLNWFAERLFTDTEQNRILVMHMFSNDMSGDPDNFASAITSMASNVIDIINAYNAEGTITVNGTPYDYHNIPGKVRCILCGHTHYDKVYIATGDIPVICIDDGTAIGTSSKLILDACFADYDNGKLYAYRDGATTREITLA